MEDHTECQHELVNPILPKPQHPGLLKLKITQEFFVEVDTDWYDPYMLTQVSDKPDFIEQIIDYEKDQISKDRAEWRLMQRGETTIEAVPKEEVQEQEHVQEDTNSQSG